MLHKPKTLLKLNSNLKYMYSWREMADSILNYMYRPWLVFLSPLFFNACISAKDSPPDLRPGGAYMYSTFHYLFVFLHSTVHPQLSEHQTCHSKARKWSQAEHNLILFSEDIYFNFVNKLCCDYHQYQTQNVIFFSVMVKKGQKVILNYPNFPHIQTACL